MPNERGTCILFSVLQYKGRMQRYRRSTLNMLLFLHPLTGRIVSESGVFFFISYLFRTFMLMSVLLIDTANDILWNILKIYRTANNSRYMRYKVY